MTRGMGLGSWCQEPKYRATLSDLIALSRQII